MSSNPPVDLDHTQSSEQQAIRRLKAGDLSGLELLVTRYQVRAVHTALLILGERAAAEDLVQELFFQIPRKLNTFDEQRPFAPWFMRSVVNAALKTARRRERFISLDQETTTGENPAEAWLVDPNLCPEDLAITAETRQQIWAALGKLKPEQRAVVVLRYYLEMSDSEITAALDRPLTTVKWWLHAARMQLKKLLSRLTESTNAKEV